MCFRPFVVFVIVSTASAWVWSTNRAGRIACRIASTDGAGASRGARELQLLRHLRVGQLVELGQREQRDRAGPARSPASVTVARSEPEPLTYSTSTGRPKRSVSTTFTEVFPPPCMTSAGSAPSSRDV